MRRMCAFVLLFVAAVSAGCDDDPTAVIDLDSIYVARSADGEPLPLRGAVTVADCTFDLDNADLLFDIQNRFTLSLRTTMGCSGTPAAVRHLSTTGTYVQAGERLTATPGINREVEISDWTFSNGVIRMNIEFAGSDMIQLRFTEMDF